MIYLKKSTVGFLKKKLICIREIPELQVDNEKCLSYRVRFAAISMRREVVVAEFSTFYARRRFCAKLVFNIANCRANDVFLAITCPQSII